MLADNDFEFRVAEILDLINTGYHQLGVYQQLLDKGHNIPRTTVALYVRRLAKKYIVKATMAYQNPLGVGSGQVVASTMIMKRYRHLC